jgi:AraC-binding-like domain
MDSSGIVNRLVAARQIQIGRLSIDIATIAPRPTPDREVADASYLLVIPLTGPVHFSQSSRSGLAKPGEYVLLSRMAYYELFAEGDPALIYVRIPAAELRGRLACVDDHVGRRFSANENMTRLLVGLIRGVAEIFADRPPPNPEALATEIVSFVVLAIGAENRGAVGWWPIKAVTAQCPRSPTASGSRTCRISLAPSAASSACRRAIRGARVVSWTAAQSRRPKRRGKTKFLRPAEDLKRSLWKPTSPLRCGKPSESNPRSIGKSPARAEDVSKAALRLGTVEHEGVDIGARLVRA